MFLIIYLGSGGEEMINIPVFVSLVIIFTLIIVIGVSVLIIGYYIIYWNFFHKRARIIKFCENDEMKLSQAFKVFEVNTVAKNLY